MSSFPRCLTKTLSAILLVICCTDGLTKLAAQVNLSQAIASRELEIYAKARSVVDMTFDELFRAFPGECSDLEFDDNQEGLPLLLRQVGDRVAALVRDIPNTTSRAGSA